MTIRRRLLLTSILSLFWASAGTWAQAPVAPWFTFQKIGPNVWAAIDNPKSERRSYANAGVVIGDDAVLVIDTLTADDAARHLLQEIRQLTNLPIKFVVNTHYHGDH